MAPFNEQYSYGDFTGRSFVDQPAGDFDGTEIIGSCFYRESPYSAEALTPAPRDPRVAVFPAGMRGVIFKRCNLDNVIVPPGNMVWSQGDWRSSNRRIRIQNDLEDWVLTERNKPLEPVLKKQFEELGLSTSPNHIPAKKQKQSLTQEVEEQLVIES